MPVTLTQSRPLSGPTRLPRGPFTAIILMYLANSLNLTILFPFVALMVKSFHVTEDITKLGYYAGMVGSSAFFGSFLSNGIWGYISDKIGRKPVLIIGLLSNAICALIFGLSLNFPMALLVRFLSGILSAVGSTGRTCVAEVCDFSNTAKGFSVLGMVFGIGLMAGPAIGGFLSEPTEKYSWFQETSYFGKFPYFLPCVVLALVNIIALLVVIILLPETLKPVIVVSHGTTSEPLIKKNEVPSWWEKCQKILLKKNTVVSTLIFALITFISSAFNEVLPLCCITPWSFGGLSWGSNLIGLAQTSAGLALFFLQLYVYTPLVNSIGPISALRLAAASGTLVLLFPLSHLFEEKILQVVFVCLLQAARSFPQCIYTSIYMLITKSVENRKDLGFVNGVSQSVSVLFMALAPASSASLFAWSTGVQGKVINSFLFFPIIACLYLSIVGLTYLLDEEGHGSASSSSSV